MDNTFYSDSYYDEYDSLVHYGVKGMRWGVRRTPEQLGYLGRKLPKKQNAKTKKKVDYILQCNANAIKNCKKFCDRDDIYAHWTGDPEKIDGELEYAKYFEKEYFKKIKTIPERERCEFANNILGDTYQNMLDGAWDRSMDFGAEMEHYYEAKTARPFLKERLPYAKSPKDAEAIERKALGDALAELGPEFGKKLDFEVHRRMADCMAPYMRVANDAKKYAKNPSYGDPKSIQEFYDEYMAFRYTDWLGYDWLKYSD